MCLHHSFQLQYNIKVMQNIGVDWITDYDLDIIQYIKIMTDLDEL